MKSQSTANESFILLKMAIYTTSLQSYLHCFRWWCVTQKDVPHRNRMGVIQSTIPTSNGLSYQPRMEHNRKLPSGKSSPPPAPRRMGCASQWQTFAEIWWNEHIKSAHTMFSKLECLAEAPNSSQNIPNKIARGCSCLYLSQLESRAPFGDRTCRPNTSWFANQVDDSWQNSHASEGDGL